MRGKSLIFLFIALIIAGGAALLVHQWTLGQQKTVTTKTVIQETPQVEVMVAAEDLNIGTLVEQNKIDWKKWPRNLVNEAFITRSDIAQQNDAKSKTVGSVVIRSFVKGEPIIDRKILHAGTRGFLAAILNPGMRAVSIPVNRASGNGGFIRPGDYVDMLLTRKLKRGTSSDNTVTGETLIENVRVIGVDQSANDVTQQVKIAKTITIEVTPKQAEIISVADELGDIIFSLRGIRGTEDSNTGPRLVKHNKKDPATTVTMDSEASKAMGLGVRVIRGSKVETFRR